MKNNDAQLEQFLKKLKRKAELCRFAHSELKSEYKLKRNWKEFSILIISVTLVALINLYYRKLLEGDYILLLLWTLPLLTTILQGLDHTVFQWTNKASKHESAIAIWGNWLREVVFLKEHMHKYNTDIIDEKIQHIQEKYNSCMNNTTQIPNNKFLKYKEQFKIYVLKSKAIDEIRLENIENKK